MREPVAVKNTTAVAACQFSLMKPPVTVPMSVGYSVVGAVATFVTFQICQCWWVPVEDSLVVLVPLSKTDGTGTGAMFRSPPLVLVFF